MARRLIGWGAGSGFQRVCAAVPLRPDWLVDGDPSLWGRRVLGVPVRPPQALRREPPERSLVVLYSEAREEIRRELRRYGAFASASPFELPEFTGPEEPVRIPDPGGALWLEEALARFPVDRPAVVLGKGPGLARVPPDLSDRHFVVAINQAVAAVRRADLVTTMDAHNLIQLLFTPELEGRWRRALLPDGITERWDCVDVSGLPYGQADFRGVPTAIRPGWNVTRVPYAEVSRILQIERFGDRIVRFKLADTAHTHEPVRHEAFRSALGRPQTLPHHTNSAHFAFAFLKRAGVREVLTAGLGAEDGYAGLLRGVEHAYDHAYIRRRWDTTREILAELGMRIRRVEDMSDAELRGLSRGAGPGAGRSTPPRGRPTCRP